MDELQNAEAPARKRPGRPATLPYHAVQLKVNVHQNVRDGLNALATEKGVNPNAYLTELVASALGVTVQDLTPPDPEVLRLIA